jgi:uncharacterized membrane protein
MSARTRRRPGPALTAAIVSATLLTLATGTVAQPAMPKPWQSAPNGQAARVTAYEVIELPLPGYYVSDARINQRGLVAGTAGWRLGGTGFFWDERSGTVTLGGTEGDFGLITSITDLNNAGRAIGLMAGTGYVVWGAGGQMTPVPTPDGWVVDLRAINASGAIAGAGMTPGGLSFVLRRPNGQWVQSAALQAWTGLTVVGVDSSGTVAGTATGQDRTRAVVWRERREPIDLGVLPGDLDSRAAAIDNRGTVVGTSSHPDIGARAYYWTERTGMVELAGLPGATFTQAAGIDTSGIIYGSIDGRAVMWTARGELVDLASLVTLPEGYALALASGADARGRILAIVSQWPIPDDGRGTTFRAVLLVPSR